MQSITEALDQGGTYLKPLQGKLLHQTLLGEVCVPFHSCNTMKTVLYAEFTLGFLSLTQ